MPRVESMIVSNLKALEGLVWGTALGDAKFRMHRFRRPPFLMHSATGSWFLAVFQSTFEDSDLSLKLKLLAGTDYGAGLRGGPGLLSSTLQEAFSEHPTHKLLADALPCWTPLSLIPYSEEILLERLINMVHVTHWHPRVIAAGALLVGALRAILVDVAAPLEAQLEAGERLADKALHLLFERKEADTPNAIWQAHQALKYHVALGKGAGEPTDLQMPAGFDGRDSPEQLVVYALALTQAQNPVANDLTWVAEQCGSADILMPLVGGLAGFRQGLLALPRDALNLMWGKELWQRHINALAQRDFYFPCLTEAEIRLSERESSGLKEMDHIQEGPKSKNQLSLFLEN